MGGGGGGICICSGFDLGKGRKFPEYKGGKKTISLMQWKPYDFPGISLKICIVLSVVISTLSNCLWVWTSVNCLCFSIFLSFCAAWVHFCSCGASRGADWQCLLGVVLSGAWHPAWWTNAFWQNHRRRRRFLQHFLQRDWCWEACSPSRFRGSGTDCCRCV